MLGQHNELEGYYKDMFKGKLDEKSRIEIRKSKDMYIGFITRMAENDKKWFSNVYLGESLAAKRDRVQKMREKKERMK